ncbi:hypothetical protein BDR22DRAFT_961811 [Usnea florida]
MTIIRRNGKVTTTTRAIKRDRRHARKCDERQNNAHHLENLRLKAFNYNAKQSRRWLSARVRSENRGFVTKEAASQLQKHFEKSEYQLQHPRITDTVLTADAKWVLSQLELERGAAREEQGFPERVKDWWATPTMVGKKKRKGKMKGKTQGATALEMVSAEGLQGEVSALALREDEPEEQDCGISIEGEEEGGLEGCGSPVFISPAGSVVDDGEEDEEL